MDGIQGDGVFFCSALFVFDLAGNLVILSYIMCIMGYPAYIFTFVIAGTVM